MRILIVTHLHPYLLFSFLYFTHSDSREGNGDPLQYSCLENPMDGGAWWAVVHGLLRVKHDWVTSLSLFTFMPWRRKWQPTPLFLPGESQGRGSLVGCCLWGLTESDMTEATLQQQHSDSMQWYITVGLLNFASPTNKVDNMFRCHWPCRVPLPSCYCIFLFCLIRIVVSNKLFHQSKKWECQCLDYESSP